MSKSRPAKRSKPGEAALAWRASFLRELATLRAPPVSSQIGRPLLEAGNTKLGKNGRFAETVFVWNLPAMATCPGRVPLVLDPLLQR
jgi:hypothetical protein